MINKPFQLLGSFCLVMLLSVGCSSQQNQNMEKPIDQFDIQGHRGARGLLPENTIPAMFKAIDLGVNTIELDVVISADSQVVVSHEPYLSSKICTGPEGESINSADAKEKYNMYQMTYEQIALCDCGSKGNNDFPEQIAMRVSKPLLSTLIDSVEQYVATKGLKPIAYNIEIKSEEDGDLIFHPAPEVFVDMVYALVKEKGIMERSTIQSFDVRVLRVLNQKYPEVRLAYLVWKNPFYESAIESLGFVPAIYSPYYMLVSDSLIAYAAEKGMKVIPWTVNDYEKILELKKKGVDGIITDYPDRAMKLRQP
jgi:glycerophosphoryl diester phosphodiesterase